MEESVPTVYLLSLLKTGRKIHFPRRGKDDWMRRIDGIVITDEDMTGQSIEDFL